MNNFRQPKKRTRQASIDGFITKPSDTSVSKESVRSRFNKSYKPEVTGTLNARVDSDGFYRRRTPDIPHRQKETDFVEHQEENFDISDVNVDEDVISKSFENTDHKKRRFFSRKNKDKKKAPLRRKILKTSGILVVALILAVGSLFGYGYLKTRQIFKGNGDGAAALEKDVDPAKLNGEGDGRVNILMLGKGGPGHEAPDLTDTLLLASIDPVQNEAALLSVPRDFYVQDENGYSSKINAIYSNAKQKKLSELPDESSSSLQLAEDAGLRAIKESVSEVLGVPVHYYVMVNFDAFKNAIDTVGGITFNVEEPLYDYSMAWLNNGNPLIADEGLQTFDGTRALYYARSRMGSARGDFDRSERQRQVIVALQQKVLSLGTFSNPFKIVELLGTLGDNVRTDLNGTSELKRLYEIGSQIGPDRVVSLGLADPPNQLVTTSFLDNQSVVIPIEGLYQYEDIHSYVRNTLRDAFLKLEDARVVILNGTGVAGLASGKEKELKSYGYNVVSVDNAPTSDYTQNRLIDLSGQKRYTRSYLEKRLGLTASEEFIEGLPTIEAADFVIILGNDEIIRTSTN